jgi:hypothetical protein
MVISENNISLLEVASVVGEKYTADGVEYLDTRLSVLCTSKNINKWAKYKPVINDFTGDRPSDWWKGKYQDCGLTISRYHSIGEMIEGAKSNTPIVYNPPTGWSDSPYRLGDFARYDTNAIPPIEAGSMNDVYYKNFGVISTAPILTRVSEDSTWLSVADVYGQYIDINSMYFGVVVYPSSGTTNNNYMTTSNTFGNGGLIQIDFPMSTIGLAKYDVIQFLTDEKKVDLLDSGITATFIPLPIGDRWIQTIQVKQSYYSLMFAEAYYREDGTAFVTVRIKNEASNTLSVSNVYIVCRYGDSKEGDPFVVGERTVSVDNFTVLPNSTIDKSYTLTGVLPDFYSRYGWVQFSSTIGTIKSDLSFDRPKG